MIIAPSTADTWRTTMRFTRLLAFKLFIIIAGTMIAGTLVLTKLAVDWHSEQYMANTVQAVNRVSDLLKRSMRYSMLLNRREDISQIIQTVGSEPGIEAVRIYNKRGEITFSSNKAELGNRADLNHEACVACHAGGQLRPQPKTAELTRIYKSGNGDRVVGMITPIPNEPSCSEAACHAHSASQSILGVIDVMMPLKQLDASLEALRTVQYRNAFLAIVIVTSIAGMFILVMVNIPVRKLIRGTDEIRKGNLDHKIVINTNNEIGALADSFNRMTDDLKRAHEELTQWGRTLEERVKEKTTQLERAHATMMQAEKMVSLGTLAATVAHELNNPLEGVLTYAKLLKRRMADLPLGSEERLEIESELSIIADETARCGNIVKNLLLFSRQKTGEGGEVDVARVLEQSFRLIEHHFKMSNVTMETNVRESSALVTGDANQLEQAFLALEINAVEAMPEGGTFKVTITQDAGTGSIIITFRDSGIGITQEDMPHLFEPFFTTKQSGKGTGLGLAVVYGIVQSHGGSIQVHSELHKGATFTITLPGRERRGRPLTAESAERN